MVQWGFFEKIVFGQATFSNPGSTITIPFKNVSKVLQALPTVKGLCGQQMWVRLYAHLHSKLNWMQCTTKMVAYPLQPRGMSAV